MDKKSTYILAIGLFSAVSLYAAEKEPIPPPHQTPIPPTHQKYKEALQWDCANVRLEQDTVICEDEAFCLERWVAECGRKYCEKWKYAERWTLIEKDVDSSTTKVEEYSKARVSSGQSSIQYPLYGLRYVDRGRNKPVLPYGLKYKSKDGKEHVLKLRYAETAQKLEKILREPILQQPYKETPGTRQLPSDMKRRFPPP